MRVKAGWRSCGIGLRDRAVRSMDLPSGREAHVERAPIEIGSDLSISVVLPRDPSVGDDPGDGDLFLRAPGTFSITDSSRLGDWLCRI